MLPADSLLSNGNFELSDFILLEFTGEDWREWLQGQITQDIKLLSPSKPISFCMCTPTGQLLTFGDLYEKDGSAWMVIPKTSFGDVVQRVTTMVIMEDCAVRIIETPLFHSITKPSSFPCNRLGVDGFDHFEPIDVNRTEAEFEMLRLIAKRPRFGYDTFAKTLPPELGSEFQSRTIHYQKGCYTGQEVLQRIHSRGHINRTWNVYRSSQPQVNGFAPTSTVQTPDGRWLLAGYLRSDEPLPVGLSAIIEP
jgi:tRNA-modifying protein YgfZ